MSDSLEESSDDLPDSVKQEMRRIMKLPESDEEFVSPEQDVERAFQSSLIGDYSGVLKILNAIDYSSIPTYHDNAKLIQRIGRLRHNAEYRLGLRR